MQKYIDEAVRMGAAHAVAFAIDDIAFDPRTILKCMFGCGNWGHGHTCPSRPGNLPISEYERILRHYRRGVIIHHHDMGESQRISYAIEAQAYADGHYFAFSASDCSLCDECTGRSGQPCANPKKARPSFHSLGIDVFATARRFGLPIETLTDESQQPNWYSAVFIE